MEYIELLETHLIAHKLPCNERILQQFQEYAGLLQETNAVMNLTANDDDYSIVTKHFMDSVTLAAAQSLAGKKNLLDVGCGAGFPSMPCKILYPELPVTLMDATQKKLDFLAAVTEKLQLKHVTLVHGRAEELSHKAKLREGFQVVTSRAVARLSLLCELCLPFVQVGGVFAPLKLADSDEELAQAAGALKTLGGQLLGRHDYVLADTSLQYTILDIQKIAQTPKLYPRLYAKMQKLPL